MDLTHETFVHGSSIGNDAVAEAPFDVPMARDRDGDALDARHRGAAVLGRQLGQPRPVDRWQIIRFEAPCTITYRRRRGARRHRRAGSDRSQGVNGYVLNTITPETETTCHYFWAFARNYRLDRQRLTTEIREGVAGIFREDEPILEAQQRAMDENPDRVFYNLNIDAGAMWARRMIDRMVARKVRRRICRPRSKRCRRDGRRSRIADRPGAARLARPDPAGGFAARRAHLRAAGGGATASRARRCAWRWCGSRRRACWRQFRPAASW